VYQDCLIVELADATLKVEAGRAVPLYYKGRRLRDHLKLDLLVEDCIVVELKAVDRMHPVHQAQVITYLKLSGYPAGLLMNFITTSLRAGLRRLDHPDRYAPKPCG
jgi:GxxExxY protein